MPAKWPKPDFLCAAVCLRLRLSSDGCGAQPTTTNTCIRIHKYIHLHIHTHALTHTNLSDGFISIGSESDPCKRATYAKLKTKGRRCRRRRPPLLLLLLSRKNNKCTTQLRTHTNVAMLERDLLLLYAITVAFFFLPHFQLLATSTILQHFHIEITEQYFCL